MQPGDVIDDYVVERSMAEGGMAEIFLVRHTVLGSQHVLKQLLPECAARPRLRKRFLAEGRVQAQLRHRHIAAVTDLIATEKNTALIMDLLPGGTLADRLFQLPHNLSPAEAAAVLLPLLKALAFAHDQGVIHRDLKPDNILFRDNSWDEPCITDFGIAKVAQDAKIKGTRLKATRSGVTMGTPGYMAPEQIKSSGDVGPAADIFSMGVIAWEMVVGAPPFVGTTEYEVMERIVQGVRPSLEALAPNLHPAFRRVLETSIAREPGVRYGSAEAFTSALRNALSTAGHSLDNRIPRTASREVLLQAIIDSVPAQLSRLPQAPPTLSELVTEELPLEPTEEVPRSPAPPPTLNRTMATATLMGTGVLVAGMAMIATAMQSGPEPTAGGPFDPSRAYQGVGGALTRSQQYELLPVFPDGVSYVGSASDEVGRHPDETLTQVSLSRFAIGSTEVTQGLWKAVMGDNPVEGHLQDWGGITSADSTCSRWGVDDALPVYCISWADAVTFANALSAAEGLPPAYTIQEHTVTWNPRSSGYRLPTEVEWEVAARAGSATPYAPAASGQEMCGFANVPNWWTSWWHPRFEIDHPAACSDSFTALAPVAHHQANVWGLFDTTGNVAEWVWDTYDDRGVNPKPATTRRRTGRTVVRGGSWASEVGDLRTARRDAGDPRHRSWLVGLRLARTID